MSSTIEDAHIARWNLLVKGIPYNRDFGIPTFWRANPQLGSPIGPEIDLGNGAKAQSFAGGVVQYQPDVGCSIVTA